MCDIDGVKTYFHNLTYSIKFSVGWTQNWTNVKCNYDNWIIQAIAKPLMVWHCLIDWQTIIFVVAYMYLYVFILMLTLLLF